MWPDFIWKVVESAVSYQINIWLPYPRAILLINYTFSLLFNLFAKINQNYKRRKIRERFEIFIESFPSKSCWDIQFDKEGSFSKTKQDVNAILKISKHWRNMMPLSHSFIIRTEQLIWKFFVNGIMPIIIENELKKG